MLVSRVKRSDIKKGSQLIEDNYIFQELDRKIQECDFILFDLDGTLINTDYANYLSYKKAIEQITKSRFHLSFDPSKRFTRDVIRKLIPDLSKDEHKKIIKMKEILYVDYLHKTKLNRTIVNLLYKYSTKKNVLVTNSCQERAVMLLRHHGIIDNFSHCIYRQINAKKSNINKFKYALTTLQIHSDSVFVFENEESEINAAIIAGIPNENIFKRI